jgi:hypothetical protein
MGWSRDSASLLWNAVSETGHSPYSTTPLCFVRKLGQAPLRFVHAGLGLMAQKIFIDNFLFYHIS